MTDTTSLDAILSGAAVEPAVLPNRSADEPEPAPEDKLTFTSNPDPKGESATPPVAEKEPEKAPRTVPLEALSEERRKRQDLDGQLRQMRDELEALKAPKPEKVGLLDDPDKWEQQLQTRMTEVEGRAEAKAQALILNFLETQAKAAHTDYDEAVGFFAETAKDNPALVDEARRAPNPVEYVYTAGKRLKMLNEAGDLDTLLERERTKAREEGRQEAFAEGRKLPEVPESLTEITGAKADGHKPWSPKPLNQILARN